MELSKWAGPGVEAHGSAAAANGDRVRFAPVAVERCRVHRSGARRRGGARPVPAWPDAASIAHPSAPAPIAARCFGPSCGADGAAARPAPGRAKRTRAIGSAAAPGAGPSVADAGGASAGCSQAAA